MKVKCEHAMICFECFKQYLQIKLKDEDVVPWFRCPAPNCFQPIHCDLLMLHLTPKQLCDFAGIFLRKHLARNPNWIKCRNDKNCEYGFVVLHNEKKRNEKIM